MKRSTDRILTTHAGSLPRPDDLLEAYRERPAEASTAARLRSAVAEVVRQQVAVGVDVVNDGEYGKPMTEAVDYGAWATYAYGRMSGFEQRELTNVAAILKEIMGDSKDRKDFAAFYASASPVVERRGPPRISVNVGPIEYTGQALVQRDIDNFKAALAATPATDAYMSAVFTGVQFGRSEYYKSNEEQAVACAEAMREEYRAIVNAGLNLQIDDPILVNVYEFHYSENRDVANFRKWAGEHVALVNHALEGIPEERVRYHLCWGSWHGPHSADLPLREVIDLLVKVKASQYSFEAANPQHEHEWKVWKDVKLPDGRALIPGVVTHKTTILEHPEVVCDRIVRYANIVGRENVIAGTDCGMGGRIHPQVAWAKLKALADGAALATKQLW
ncbi:MAG TPA: cobalamin-independent methionine synthase II family protein [Gammaproteobacteria bacterium]|nr:cobalamin-independent methionine synthase II family protein [Gammaproteobacteria bacterium]